MKPELKLSGTISEHASESDWDIIFRPKNKWYNIDIKGIWHYRDLIKLFVRRDFVAQYKQSLLGPLWILIQPLLTTILYALIFGFIARVPMGGIPPALFIMTAFIPWIYFADCISKTATTFTGNSAIFGKVYFPRLVSPISVIISSLFKFCIQLFLLAGIFIYYKVFHGVNVKIDYHIIFLPLLILLLAGCGLAIGLIVSSLTTRYRDLGFLIGFFIQFLMYGSSVVIPYTTFKNHETIYAILKWNPLLWIMEAFRRAVLGVGEWSWLGLFYACGFMLVLLFIAIVIFSKVERSFMDTV
ncbi:MAG: ABC transporter permease [Bacteroidota bacterium]|nr:ABC transporter permease [Bacteroidota bacterium]